MHEFGFEHWAMPNIIMLFFVFLMLLASLSVASLEFQTFHILALDCYKLIFSIFIEFIIVLSF